MLVFYHSRCAKFKIRNCLSSDLKSPVGVGSIVFPVNSKNLNINDVEHWSTQHHQTIHYDVPASGK